MKREILCKRILFLFIIASVAQLVFSQTQESYVIESVRYNIEGHTRESSLQREYPVEQKKQFSSIQELESYLEDYSVELKNQRNFESSSVTWEIIPQENQSSAQSQPQYQPQYQPQDQLQSENQLLPQEQQQLLEPSELQSAETAPVKVAVTVNVKDSRHFLALPYIKYDTNTGFMFKFKAKDTNFLGTLEEFNCSVSYLGEEALDGSGKINHKLETCADFAIPFSIGDTKVSWVNDWLYSYDFFSSQHEFYVDTGFDFYRPMNGGTWALALDVNQKIQQEWDYSKFGDQLFFSTDAAFTTPIILNDFGQSGKIVLTPMAGFSWNYDSDGISNLNMDLVGPEVKAGASISFGQVNWTGNFRDGLKGSVEVETHYNIGLNNFCPYAQAELFYFKSLGFAGINLHTEAFFKPYHPESVGGKLRGIKDRQFCTIATDSYGFPVEALLVSSAFVLNADFPIRVIVMDWNRLFCSMFGEDSSACQKLSFMSIFNFELQLSPFFDMALVCDSGEAASLLPTRGLYSAGMEMIVFPEKWKSFYVRASAGVDLGQTLLSKINDTSWKRPCNPWEVYIGLGLHY